MWLFPHRRARRDVHGAPRVGVGFLPGPVAHSVVVDGKQSLVVVLVAPQTDVDVVLQHQGLEAEANVRDADPTVQMDDFKNNV